MRLLVSCGTSASIQLVLYYRNLCPEWSRPVSHPAAWTLALGSQASLKQETSYPRDRVTEGGKRVGRGRKCDISPGNLSQSDLVDCPHPFAGLV